MEELVLQWLTKWESPTSYPANLWQHKNACKTKQWVVSTENAQARSTYLCGRDWVPSQTFTSPLRLKILWRIWWRLWNSLLEKAPMHIHPKVCIQFMGLWVPELIHLRLTQLLSSCNNEYGRTCWWREVLCPVLVVMHLRCMWQDIQVEMSPELFKMLPGFVRLCKYV